MEIIDNQHTRTGSDFAYLGELLGETSGILPKLPLHGYGELNIQYSVLEDTPAKQANRFAEIAADLRAIAEDQCLKFAEETTSITSEDKHHRATLIMPHCRVMYTAVWIEKAEVSDSAAHEGDEQ